MSPLARAVDTRLELDVSCRCAWASSQALEGRRRSSKSWAQLLRLSSTRSYPAAVPGRWSSAGSGSRRYGPLLTWTHEPFSTGCDHVPSQRTELEADGPSRQSSARPGLGPSSLVLTLPCLCCCTYQFTYINSSFSPAPDDTVSNLFKVSPGLSLAALDRHIRLSC